MEDLVKAWCAYILLRQAQFCLLMAKLLNSASTIFVPDSGAPTVTGRMQACGCPYSYTMTTGGHSFPLPPWENHTATYRLQHQPSCTYSPLAPSNGAGSSPRTSRPAK